MKAALAKQRGLDNSKKQSKSLQVPRSQHTAAVRLVSGIPAWPLGIYKATPALIQASEYRGSRGVE